MTTVLRQRIIEFVRNAEAGDFGELALELFSEQYGRLAGYREACVRQGVTPETLSAWREIPMGAAPASGSIELEAHVIATALPELFRSGPLSLIVGSGPEDPETAGTGVGALLEILSSHAPEGSFVSRNPKLDTRALRSWLGERQRDRRPVRLIGSAAGYERLLEFLDRRGLKFRLPPGSVAHRLIASQATGSTLGAASLNDRLGLSPEACPLILCQSGATPFLENPGGSGRFRLPHWVRAVAYGADRPTLLDLASLDAPAHRKAPGLNALEGGEVPVFEPVAGP